MIRINTSTLDATVARLRGLSENKIKTAMVGALNKGAYAGMKAAQEEIRSVFDRPTPWIQKSARYWKATKDKPEAKIDLDFWGNKQGVSSEDVLRAEVQGGQRRHKRHEIALQRAGILPPGMAIVPGEGAKMDAYGNMQAGQINQILAWFSAFGEQGYKANMTVQGRARLGRDKKRTGAKGFQYFALQRQRGKLRPGIYQRFNFYGGSGIKPIMIFVRVPSYRPRLKFYGVAEKAALEEIHKVFPEYLDQMLKERGL